MNGEEDDLGQLEELPMSDDENTAQQKTTEYRRRYYSTEELLDMRNKPGCKLRPSCLSPEFCDASGIWDPSLWHASLFGRKNSNRSREFSNNFSRRQTYRNSFSQNKESNHVSVFLKNQRQFCPRLTQRSFRRYKFEHHQNDCTIKAKIDNVCLDNPDNSHDNRKLSDNKSDYGEPEWMSASSEQLDDFEFGDLEDLKKQYNENIDEEIALNARDIESRIMGCESSGSVFNRSDNVGNMEVNDSSAPSEETCEKNEEMEAFNNLLLKMKDASDSVGVVKPQENCPDPEAKIAECAKDINAPVFKANWQESLNRLNYRRILDDKASKLVQNEVSWPKSWNSDRVQGLTEPKFHGLNIKETALKNQRCDVGHGATRTRAVDSNSLPHTLEALFLEHNASQHLAFKGHKVSTPLEMKLMREKEVLIARIAALQALQVPSAYGLNNNSAKTILQLNLEKQVLESQLHMYTKNLMTALQESKSLDTFVRNDNRPANLADMNAIMQARTEAILRLNGINLRKHPSVGLLNFRHQNPGTHGLHMSPPIQNLSHSQLLGPDLLVQHKIAEILQARGAYSHS